MKEAREGEKSIFCFVLCWRTTLCSAANCARVHRCAIFLPSRHTDANSGLHKRVALTVVRQAAPVPIQSLYQMSQADCWVMQVWNGTPLHSAQTNEWVCGALRRTDRIVRIGEGRTASVCWQGSRLPPAVPLLLLLPGVSADSTCVAFKSRIKSISAPNAWICVFRLSGALPSSVVLHAHLRHTWGTSQG